MRLKLPALALATTLAATLIPFALADSQDDAKNKGGAAANEVILLVRHEKSRYRGDLGLLVAKAMQDDDAKGLTYERIKYTNCFIFRRTASTSSTSVEWDDDDDDDQDDKDAIFWNANDVPANSGKHEINAKKAAEEMADDIEDVLKEVNLKIRGAEPNYFVQTPYGNPSNIRVLGDETVAQIATQSALAELGLDTLGAETTGQGIVVAVIDTGIDATHPMFEDRILEGGLDLIDGDMDPTDVATGEDGDGDGLIDEEYGHGTFVASMVLTAAPDAMILPIRALNSEGHGEVINLAAAIMFAVERGVDVINVSASLEYTSEMLEEAMNIADMMDVIVVASAGNDGNRAVGYPARYDKAIAVTAVNEDDIVPTWANIGPKVDVSALGVDVLGAYPTDANSAGTARWSGTSFSAPLVAGTLAALYSTNPWDDAKHFTEALLKTALDVDDQNNEDHKDRIGKGRIRPVDALDEL